MATAARADTDPVSPAFTYHTYPFYLLSRTSGCYNRAMERALKPLGLDQARWRVLVILAEDGPLSIGDIAEAAVYKASTLSRIIGRMQAAGHLDVAPRASDNRVVEVSLSPAGRELYARSMSAASRVYRRACEVLNEAEFKLLSDLLIKVAEPFAT
ncbi:MarR family winged helix-turn-helix transcriptional regulator [Caulobacter sp. S45]|jgi:DNA-binding MarR family transcriptional regulator|uniref:MarR family winged helix-turn-helix transcriptional regulator n=1 Tax=Caulobacter sp. S45 TaxID=1641861 RepID=UPI00131E43F4|nr:MarR family transcriptional regulator [Caulobacter sp. S45]